MLHCEPYYSELYHADNHDVTYLTPYRRAFHPPSQTAGAEHKHPPPYKAGTIARREACAEFPTGAQRRVPAPAGGACPWLL